ncbi:unnamed protein product [Oppiella nova]|uniref:Uncharacterized protein n=1 Tax=Oppiella nova TaxID=334625 RepID=A0A7R9QF60_9ACAR|nr:unnamed protein product [Oppiella nova]CAG2164685.1 unnamed protein product [Oppiella nova]
MGETDGCRVIGNILWLGLAIVMIILGGVTYAQNNNSTAIIAIICGTCMLKSYLINIFCPNRCLFGVGVMVIISLQIALMSMCFQSTVDLDVALGVVGLLGLVIELGMFVTISPGNTLGYSGLTDSNGYNSYRTFNY